MNRLDIMHNTMLLGAAVSRIAGTLEIYPVFFSPSSLTLEGGPLDGGRPGAGRTFFLLTHSMMRENHHPPSAVSRYSTLPCFPAHYCALVHGRFHHHDPVHAASQVF